MRKLLLLLLLTCSIFAKTLYLSYENIPQRVIVGEIFPVTIKVLSTIDKYSEVDYSFSNAKGLKLLDKLPTREKNGKYYFDTFNFIAKSNSVILPKITGVVNIGKSEIISEPTYIKSQSIDVVKLNPRDDFSNIVANDFRLLKYKTSSYDDKHNIVVLTAQAVNADLSRIEFKNVFKQEIESLKSSYKTAQITYIVVINKELMSFDFSYFNLLKNDFLNISVPIIISDDSVSTQSDLKPKNQTHQKIKLYVVGSVVIFALVLIIWRQKYIYLILLIIPAIYIAYLTKPQENICIKEGSHIYLLPMHNGTVFEKTTKIYHLHKEGSVKKFVKVKLENNKIGWVKNEDVCSN